MKKGIIEKKATLGHGEGVVVVVVYRDKTLKML
jgi:hypothetical protein